MVEFRTGNSSLLSREEEHTKSQVLLLVLLCSSWMLVWKGRNASFCVWKTQSSTPKKKQITKIQAHTTSLIPHSSLFFQHFLNTTCQCRPHRFFIKKKTNHASSFKISFYLSQGPNGLCPFPTVNSKLENPSLRKMLPFVLCLLPLFKMSPFFNLLWSCSLPTMLHHSFSAMPV